jgi:hypothetical protein
MFGNYPCCDGPLAIGLDDEETTKTPVYFPEDCPHCGAKVWHIYSRVWPQTFLEADFFKEYDVDFETRIVKSKK